MNDANGCEAATPLESLDDSMGAIRGEEAPTDARTAIEEVIRVLGNDKVSYKASV